MLQAMTMHESAQAKPVTNGTDCELLRRYAQVGDAAAFSALVERHAEMVHATCLRVLGETQDAEDAGQAVFLLLTRKARALPKGTVLAGWLYRTATFVAREARHKRRTRRRHEREAQAMRTQATSAVLPDAEQAQVWEQLRSTLDAELAALPATQRDALVLRYLQGRSLEDAAQEMNCPAGTLAVRASRGLEQLRVRLTQRGVVLPSALLSTVLMVHAVPTAPAGFAASVQAACLGKAGASVGSLALVEVVMKAWFWIKVKVALCVTALVLVGGMGVTTAYQALEEEKPLEATPPELGEKGSPQPGLAQSNDPIREKSMDPIGPKIVDSFPQRQGWVVNSVLHILPDKKELQLLKEMDKGFGEVLSAEEAAKLLKVGKHNLAHRITTFSGKQASITVGEAKPYVEGYDTGSDQPIDKELNIGFRFEIKSTISSDHKYVTVEFQPIYIDLVRMDEKITAEGVVQRPVVIEHRIMLSTMTVPDGSAVLLEFPEVKTAKKNVAPFCILLTTQVAEFKDEDEKQ